jgi:hypothetical protein
MADSNNDDRKGEREYYGKILSIAFTLLGLLVGFYGVISSGIIEVGGWKPERDQLLPFLSLLSIAITIDCILGILAVLGMAGYIRARLSLTVLSCVLLAIIGVFILTRTIQIWIF